MKDAGIPGPWTLNPAPADAELLTLSNQSLQSTLSTLGNQHTCTVKDAGTPTTADTSPAPDGKHSDGSGMREASCISEEKGDLARVRGLRFGVRWLVSGVWYLGLGFGASVLVIRGQGFGLRAQGFGFWVQS